MSIQPTEGTTNKFVIKHDTWGASTYYVKHGEFAGKKEAMSYNTKPFAKQFDSKESAEQFIANELPEWTKKERYIAEEITPYEVMLGIEPLQTEETIVEEMKKQYETALDEFIPLRNKEVDEGPLTEEETKRYLELVEGSLLPLAEKLHEAGEEKYLFEYQFSYEM